MKNDLTLLSKAAVRGSDTLFTQFARMVLERQASLMDHNINDDLLKDLIMKYMEAEKKLRELNEMKNKFLGMAAHDIRNPLVSIRGFAELLQDEGMDEESRKEFLGIIHNTSNELLGLLNDLLDVSLIESGKFDLRMSKGDLGKLLRDRMHLMQMAAKKKDMALETQFDEVPEIPFDRERIAQVVDNFLSNAVKFSPRGAVIRVFLKQEESKVRVEVQDHGPGISEEEQKKLFGEFQKLTAMPTGGEKSTGLGLAIVKKIVTAHKGEIGVTSKVGEGSVFYFTLPQN
jgi:signal transduction histidine kinase